MDNILIEFNDKKTKSKYLKSLEFINHRFKNIFNSVYINNEGYCFSTDVINRNIGRIFLKTDLIKDLFTIEERDLLQLYPKQIYDCIKSGKTKIISILSRDDSIYMITTENEYKIADMIKEQKLNIDKYLDIIDNISINKNVDNLLERLLNKEFVDFEIDGYRMFLTHKLFPTINKIDTINIGINDTQDKTFYAMFEFISKEKDNKITTNYLYRFAKI